MGKQQKVVMKVAMEDEKKRRKAFQIASGFCGVDSVGIEGEDKDQMVVIGVIDPVTLTKRLRKEMRHAELLTVTAVESQAEKETESTSTSTSTSVQVGWPAYQYAHQPRVYEIQDAAYDQQCCSIM